MDLRVLSLVGSLALNAALLGTLAVRPALAPESLRPYLPREKPSASDPATRRVAPVAAPAAKAAGAAELWSALHSTDLRTLVERLRAAGFPPALVRAIVDAEVERQFGPRIKELLRTVTETPYWKPDPGYYTGNSKLFEEVSQIYRERSRVLRDLLGRDAYAYAGIDPTVAQRRQYGNLSQAKIDLVQRINEDYAEMTGQIRSAMQGIALPEDREKLALLEREKRADLAAVLSPEELADYEMRTSPVTSRLRTALTILDASESEFRRIFEVHNAQKDILYPTSGISTVFTPDLMDRRREATKQVLDQLKTTLGDSRFADYQRAIDNDFQQLYRLGQRDNVPYDSLVRAFELRGPIAEASVKIIDNPDLSADAKRTALRDLAQDARTKLLSTLGPAAGPTYVSNSRWLMYLDQGRGITIAPDGNISMRTGPMPRPATTATPKS